MCIKKTVNMKKDLKKEMVDYKISLLRDLYVQHEKPSTITVKKNAILKQMEQIFEEINEDTFPDTLTLLEKVKVIIFTSNEFIFILEAERSKKQILYKKHNGCLKPCVRISDSEYRQMNLNENIEVKASKQMPSRNYLRYEKTMLVFPKD